MKVTNRRLLGMFINPETCRPVNIYKANEKDGGWDVLFHYFRQQRVYVPMKGFYELWKKP